MGRVQIDIGFGNENRSLPGQAPVLIHRFGGTSNNRLFNLPAIQLGYAFVWRKRNDKKLPPRFHFISALNWIVRLQPAFKRPTDTGRGCGPDIRCPNGRSQHDPGRYLKPAYSTAYQHLEFSHIDAGRFNYQRTSHFPPAHPIL